MSTSNPISGHTLHKAIVREVGPLVSKVEIPEWVGTGALVSVPNDGIAPVVGTSVFVAANRMNDKVSFISGGGAGGAGGAPVRPPIVWRMSVDEVAIPYAHSDPSTVVLHGMGDTISLAVGESVIVFGVFSIRQWDTAGYGDVQLWVNGTAQSGVARDSGTYVDMDDGDEWHTVSQNWLFTAPYAGSFIFQFHGTISDRKSFDFLTTYPASGAYQILSDNTTATVVFQAATSYSGGYMNKPITVVTHPPTQYAASAEVLVNIAPQTIPGIDHAIDLLAGDIVYIFGVFDVTSLTGTGDLIAELWVNGTPIGANARYHGYASFEDRATISQNWVVGIPLPGLYEFSFAVYLVDSPYASASDEAYTVFYPNTQMTLWVTSQVEVLVAG